MGKRDNKSDRDGNDKTVTARRIQAMVKPEDVPAKGKHAAENKGKDDKGHGKGTK